MGQPGKRIAIHVTPAAERALRGGHPWVFDKAVLKQSRDGQAGDLAVIFDSQDRFMAVGLYDPASPIRIRVLQHRTQATIDQGWFTDRLRAAADVRRKLVATTGYRLVHGENDGLPGLVVDRYAETLVMKLYTAAWFPHLDAVIAGLQAVQPFDRLVLRLSRGFDDLQDGQILVGEPLTGPVQFLENGLHFAADVVLGHKTGFYFDQRDNRARVRDLSAGASVLNVFAYSGAFSVCAAAGGAKFVLSLDISAPALEAAEANFALNQDHPRVAAARHTIMVADAFDALEQLHAERRTFGLVIVDPPSFAKSEAEVDRALVAYARLTRLALGVLSPGGELVMSSCSSRVTPDAFFKTVQRAARDSGRPLANITTTGHALDHPITFPEGEYLKCLFGTVAR